MGATPMVPLSLVLVARLIGVDGVGVCAGPGASTACTACTACCADLSIAACHACQINQCDVALQCDPVEEGGCTVCPACCHEYFRAAADCAACSTAECALEHVGDVALSPPLDPLHSVALTAVALLPHLSRSLTVLLSLFCASCSLYGREAPSLSSSSDGDTSSEEEEERLHLTRDSPRAPRSGALGFLMPDLCSKQSSWASATSRAGLLHCGALALATGRLFVHHALQPTSYLLALAVCLHDLSTLQLWLGGIVACREVCYLLTTVRCVFANPAFLLVDVPSSVTYVRELAWLSVDDLCFRAARVGVEEDDVEKARVCDEPEPRLAALIMARATIWQHGHIFATMYMVAPEKFLAAALLDRGGLDKRGVFGVSWLAYGVCDLCAVSALSVGLQSGEVLPLPLVPGYCATAVAMLSWTFGLGTGNRQGREIASLVGVATFLAAALPVLIEWYT